MRRVLLLLVPNVVFSAAMVQHSTSLLATIVYLVGAPLALAAALRVLNARTPLERRRWLGPAALIGFFLVASMAFLLIYPIADARKAIGAGTDTDDALDLAVRSLLSGQYLYQQRTYLNNPISQLPGWVGLAAPFVIAFGRAAYLNVFWLAVWLALLAIETRSALRAALLGAVTFVFFPGVSILFLNGSDQIASVVAVGLLLVVLQRGRLGALPLGVATGVVLSSRFNVVLLLPVNVALVGRKSGWPSALVYGVLAGLTWLVVSFLPWVVNPMAFTPLHTYGMLGRFDRAIPYFGLLVPLAAAGLAVWLAWRVWRHGDDPWRAMALVLSLPVLCGFLADLLVTRNLDFWPLVYGLMAAPLWVGAAAPGVGRLLAADAPAASPEVAQPPFWRLMPRWAAPRRS